MEGTDNAVIGEVFGGAVVTNIKEETSKRWDDRIRVRKMITLETGVILIEDTICDAMPLSDIKGKEYGDKPMKDIEYPKSPKSSEKESKKKKKKDKKKKAHKRSSDTTTPTTTTPTVNTIANTPKEDSAGTAGSNNKEDPVSSSPSAASIDRKIPSLPFDPKDSKSLGTNDNGNSLAGIDASANGSLDDDAGGDIDDRASLQVDAPEEDAALVTDDDNGDDDNHGEDADVDDDGIPDGTEHTEMYSTRGDKDIGGLQRYNTPEYDEDDNSYSDRRGDDGDADKGGYTDDATLDDDIDDDDDWNPEPFWVYGPGARELDEFDHMDDEVYYYDLESLSDEGERNDLFNRRKQIATREAPRAVWKWSNDDNKKDCAPKMPRRTVDSDDSDLWEPRQILLYDKDHPPPLPPAPAASPELVPPNRHDSIATTESAQSTAASSILSEADLSSGKPVLGATDRGIWARAPDAKRDESTGHFKPNDTWIFAPGQAPPKHVKPAGVWVTANKLDVDWPPKLDEARKLLRPVNKLPMFAKEATDDGNIKAPDKVWICGNGSPDLNGEIDGEHRPTATWKFSPDAKGPDDQGEWKPVPVMLHHHFEPPSDEPVQMTKDGKPIRGFWGYAPNAVPDENGNYRPEDTWVYAPDEKPPANWKAQGVWTPGKLDIDWPPETKEVIPLRRSIGKLPKAAQQLFENAPTVGKPRKMKVYGKGNDDLKKPLKPRTFNRKKADPAGGVDANPAPLKGTWKFNPKSKEPEGQDDWKPQDIVAYKGEDMVGPDPDSDAGDKDKDDSKPVVNRSPSGVWGFDPDAAPDDDGNCKPSDVWVFGPSEEPPKDWNPQGVWAYPSGQQQEDCPPYTATKPKLARTVGKIPKDMLDEKWRPQQLWAYGKGNLGLTKPRHDRKPKGTWKFGSDDDEPSDVAKWKPQELWLYDKEHEPEELDDDEPHGVWGHNPDAKPNSDGTWKPQDMWVYAPGRTPPDDWTPQGTWTYAPPKPPPGKLRGDWPPKNAASSDAVKAARKKVIRKWPPSPENNGKGRKVGKLSLSPFLANDEKNIKGTAPNFRKTTKKEPTKSPKKEPVKLKKVSPKKPKKKEDEEKPKPEEAADDDVPTTPVPAKTRTIGSPPGSASNRFSSPSILGSPPRTKDPNFGASLPDAPLSPESQKRQHAMMSDWKSPFEYKPKLKVTRSPTRFSGKLD